MPVIYVIIPVYNVEKYIHRCIDSVLAQTYRNLRIILVNDGSPDRCPEICDAYTAKDPRVHVIHQKNNGPSSARNRGLDHALANIDCAFIAFVDSDDCLNPVYFQSLYNAVCSTDAGASMCSHHYIRPNDTLENVEIPKNNMSTTLMSAEDLMVTQTTSFNYPWGKLFSRKCFENLRFPEDISFGEDNLVIYRALFRCEHIAYVDEKLYFYFYNQDGITKSPWSERSLQVFLGIENQIAYYKSNGFEKAYNKEIELYIQQCAYQIHRIREDRTNIKVNINHLLDLRFRMRKMIKTHPNFRLIDNPFWYESLHPILSKMQTVCTTIRQTYQDNSIGGVIRLIKQRIHTFINHSPQ